MLDHSSNVLELKLLQVAHQYRDEHKGFGGPPASLTGLFAQDVLNREHSIEEIRTTLKRMHGEGKIYIQYWAGDRQWVEWSPNEPDTFFNDFRLLVADPRKKA